ncbi:unnamed protein product [Caenorhabditis angaria]|uniref:SEFIR domain-containing protein n=1 Tax=Caenorhabditis angaria TaxID=860376 RepID=A0A9P1IN04_9PELO|nr:unnamed protein product [Caenorhabditis angaria]
MLLKIFVLLSSWLTTVTPSLETLPSSEIVHHFKSDCSEVLNKEASCLVKLVDCSDPIYPLVEDGLQPPSAHDLRVAPIVKAAGANQLNATKHSLFVDISWQMRIDDINHLEAFKLHVYSTPNGQDETCFVFNVTQHNITDLDSHSSSRYRFSSSTLFKYARQYHIDIHSLPMSENFSPAVGTVLQMPEDPEKINAEDFCKYNSNSQASRWAASFRKIFRYSEVRKIQIEFLAAPPTMCFEEYEVRLLDSDGVAVVDSGFITKADLKTEMNNGKLVTFGGYNFTNLQLEVNYIPSVIPVERAEDGRCLCPSRSGCGCLAAEWKHVKLTNKFKNTLVNVTIPKSVENSPKKNDPTNPYIIVLITGSIATSVILTFCCCMAAWFKRYKQKLKKDEKFDFIGNKKVYGQCGKDPLIMQEALSVLILYSHDCSQHDAAVLAFAELLRDVYRLNVHLDVWDDREIEENRAEYVNSCVVRADKIIIVNSIGSQNIVGARRLREPHMERIVPGMLDNLFIHQIDLALQHVSVISVRFPYTPKTCTLFSLTPLLQYSIPENINQFISRLMDTPRPINRLTGFNPQFSKLQAAFSRMLNFIEEEPYWYEQSHHRVPIIPRSLENSTEVLRISETIEEEDEDALEGEEEEELEIELAEPNDQNDSGILDSAYVSGSDFSTQLDSDVLFDKPRISEFTDLKIPNKHQDSAYHDEVIDVN